MLATLADFLEISKALDSSLDPVYGGPPTSAEALQPPLQYIGKLYKGLKSLWFTSQNTAQQ